MIALFCPFLSQVIEKYYFFSPVSTSSLPGSYMVFVSEHLFGGCSGVHEQL